MLTSHVACVNVHSASHCDAPLVGKASKLLTMVRELPTVAASHSWLCASSQPSDKHTSISRVNFAILRHSNVDRRLTPRGRAICAISHRRQHYAKHIRV